MNLTLIAALAAAVAGAAIGGTAAYEFENRALQAEKAAHAQDTAKYEAQRAQYAAAAAQAASAALAQQQAQATQIADLDDQLTKEKQAHEIDSRNYAAALASGAQRVRVAVRNCAFATAGSGKGAAAPGVDDGGAATADLDPAVASRVFSVAGDDQREIDKLRALQAYVCTIRPDAPGCAAGVFTVAPTQPSEK